MIDSSIMIRPTPAKPFAALSLLCLASIAILHYLSLTYPDFDPGILNRIHAHATPALTLFAKTLSAIGSPRTVWPLTILLSAILWLRRPAYLLALTLVAAGTLENLIKLAVRRPRATLAWTYVHERSYSFPSGHATLALALYGTFVWLTFRTPHPHWQRAVTLFAAITLIPAIGFSRLYLGVHYPTDVLAGYLTGAACLALAIAADLAL